jgi:predicted nuclease of predicted toxin-antitoxin system
LRLLLDEMYSGVHAQALRAVDIDACTVIELGLAGSSDPEVFAAAVVRECTLLTENVADYARISAQHLTAGQHHTGVLIALSSRFSRRRAGIPLLVQAILGIAGQELTDRVIYLPAPDGDCS